MVQMKKGRQVLYPPFSLMDTNTSMLPSKGQFRKTKNCYKSLTQGSKRVNRKMRKGAYNKHQKVKTKVVENLAGKKTSRNAQTEQKEILQDFTGFRYKTCPRYGINHLLAGRIPDSNAEKTEVFNQYFCSVFGEKPDDSGQNDDEMLFILAVTKGMC